MQSAAAVQEEIARKKEALQSDFDSLRRRLEAAARSNAFGDRDALLQEVESLRQLELVYSQQAALAQLRGESAQEKHQLEEDLQQLRSSGVNEPRPFSFLLLDRLQDELDGATTHLQTVDAGVQFETEALEQAKRNYDSAERDRRAAQEALDTNRDAQRASELESALHLDKVASQVASEQVRLHELQLDNEKLNREVIHLQTVLLGEKVAQISREAKLTQKELQDQLAGLEYEEYSVTQTLDKVRQEMMSPPTPTGAKTESPGEQAEISRAHHQTLQLRFSVLSQRLQQLADLKQLWNRRYALAGGTAPSAELADWEKEARSQVDQSETQQRLYTTKLVELRRAGEESGSGAEATASPVPEDQSEIEERVRIYEWALSDTESFRRAEERLLRQIELVTQHEPLSERLAQALRVLREAWVYEIVAVQDRPITVGKIVLGIVLFILGLYISHFVSRFLGRRVWPRLGLDAGASAALQSLSYYALVVAMTLFALQVINVPLTLFTFVGGALAIGVGFGSQNIVNNFISGLILLAERPIKVGDLVEMGEMHGIVEAIGARSTRVRSTQNIHIIVPNSHFLEKEVVNWTLTDDTVKTSVAVGVAYGSPLEQVRELLVEAVSSHEQIFRAPAPIVLLNEFSDDALRFEVYFWVRIRSVMEKLVIESDVRFRIDELLRRANIEVAFPQRDVHLQVHTPLEVRLRRE